MQNPYNARYECNGWATDNGAVLVGGYCMCQVCSGHAEMHNQNVQLQNHLRSEMDVMIAQHYLLNVVEGGSACRHGWGEA